MEEKLVKEIEIPIMVSEYIQRLSYEREGYRNILCSMFVNRYDFKYRTESYMDFLGKYKKINMEYSLLLEECKETYCKKYNNDFKYTFIFDFNKSAIIVIKSEGISRRGNVNACRI